MPIGNHIGGWTGRIGLLGPMNIVGAPMAFPGMPQGMPHPGVPHPALAMGLPFGSPSPMGQLGGPAPGYAMQPNPDQGAYALVLPIPSSGSLAAAAATTVSITPQRPMRIERLVTTASAGQFTITLQAGVDNQFIASGAVDAAVFAAGAFGVALRGSTVYPGITIFMGVTNISAGALTAQGWAFIGTAIA